MSIGILIVVTHLLGAGTSPGRPPSDGRSRDGGIR